ncbi:MAG: Adenine deaminase [Chlamydiales bacterium]|nr:Adenine deaminase [Chlamydiales bacterium]
MDANSQDCLPFPIAGLMSDQEGNVVAAHYKELGDQAKLLGCSLTHPFMTLSFMALLVIPHLKLSDLELFDGDSFQLTELYI